MLEKVERRNDGPSTVSSLYSDVRTIVFGTRGRVIKDQATFQLKAVKLSFRSAG